MSERKQAIQIISFNLYKSYHKHDKFSREKCASLEITGVNKLLKKKFNHRIFFEITRQVYLISFFTHANDHQCRAGRNGS